MRNRPFVLVKDDRRPSLRMLVIASSTGEAIESMSGATATFTMKDSADTKKVDAATAVVELNADNSLLAVRYDWAAVDTDTVGSFRGQFQVADASGLPFTIPNQKDFRYIDIRIISGVDDT